MESKLIRAINFLLRPVGFVISGIAPHKAAPSIPKKLNMLQLDKGLRTYFKNSKSQHGQDWLAWQLCGRKRGEGFFVEFGVINGIKASNTYFLEKSLNWRGIVAEPARKWHESLTKNRTCSIEKNCVYKSTGEKLTFIETKDWAGGNTLAVHKSDDGANRVIGNSYTVETISLNKLLKKHQAPNYIDFISIDTEGSEFEILNAFDFSAAHFGLICIEHNHVAEKREKIQTLLEANGYHKLPLDAKFSAADDWYASEELSERFKSRFLS